MKPEPPALPAHKAKQVQPEHKVKQERKVRLVSALPVLQVRQAHRVKLD